MNIELKENESGQLEGFFVDLNGIQCTIAESTKKGAFRFGPIKNKNGVPQDVAFLSREHAQKLWPLLKHFSSTDKLQNRFEDGFGI